MKTAVYICRCGNNIADRIDLKKVLKKVQGLDEVEYATDMELMCSEEGREQLEKDLAQSRPERVVIAACSPRDHEATFRKVMGKAGLNPYLMQMTNIREQVAWVTEDRERATEKTLTYIRAAVSRVNLHVPLEEDHLDADTSVVVIGAGPAGMKAALALAGAGRKVVLVEKSPAIGGMPVRFEEVFPDMECGSCMLEPLMDEVLHGEHAENIELLTMSEVEEVLGFLGNFIVKIRTSPRHIDLDKCIGCAECVEACPAITANEFQGNMGERKAVAFPYAGALPNAPFMDGRVCLRARGEDCTRCKDACPVEGAVNFEDRESVTGREAGAILVAAGASLYDCRNLPGLGYGTVRDVYNSLEFEMILSENGPTGGEIRTSGGQSPSSVCIVHCAGSLDTNHVEYCSGVCCQYAFKFNNLISKKLPGTKIYHLYKEMVMPGKDGASLFQGARGNPDAEFIRYSDIADVSLREKGSSKKVTCRDGKGKERSMTADMVVLCPPVVPSPTLETLGATLDIPRDRSGFFEELHGSMDSAQSRKKGIYLAGACQSPMDIGQAISQGMASAGYVLSELVEGRTLDISPVTASVDSGKCSGCKVCVSVCPYKAMTANGEDGKAVLNAVLCQGCGTCVAACPTGAIEASHFTREEIMAELGEVLS